MNIPHQTGVFGRGEVGVKGGNWGQKHRCARFCDIGAARQHRPTLVVAMAVALFLAGTLSALAAAGAPTAAEQLAAKRIFPDPLVWVGSTAPTEDESAALLGAVGFFESAGVQAGYDALNGYVTAYPNSSWTPCLTVNLAEHYRSIGRYSLALQYWEAAWNETKSSSDEAGQKIAVRAIAGWTRLLASLGEKDKDTALFNELDARKLPQGIYATTIEETRGGIYVMASLPGRAYRCGSYALAHLGEAIHADPKVTSRLMRIDSPPGGFHVNQLLELARSNGIVLEAVQRPAGAEIIVPSIVHWKLNHFAAIMAQEGGRYKITDPTFGGYTWMDRSAIDAESSGTFLIPRTNAPVEWARLTVADCASIYGKGHPALENDDNDTYQDPCGGDSDASDCDVPNANDGPGDGSDTNSCCADAGMPVWQISEPYETLWLRDIPLRYRLSNGRWMKLELNFKHRGISHGSQIGSFGDKWEFNFLGMLVANGSGWLTNYMAGGGLIGFPEDGTPEYKTAGVTKCWWDWNAGVWDCSMRASVPAIVLPMRTVQGFTNLITFLSGQTNYFQTDKLDRYGRDIRLGYDNRFNMIRITNVTDIDGNTLTFTYGNSTFTNLITKVTDPYGRSANFSYNSHGLLTGITDMAGMSSTFSYDSSENITNLTTPYGQTSFQLLSGTSVGYGSVRRSVVVTEASGDHQLFSYCDEGPDGERNSYHWNRAQFQTLSSTGLANVLDMPRDDYLNAHLRQFLFNADNTTVSDTPDVEHGVGGANTRSYTYQGETSVEVVGTLKKVSEFQTESAGIVDLYRNNLGRPTNIVYTHTDGQVGSYANNFDSDGRILQSVVGPRGEWVRRYGYHPVITNLLTAVTNAAGDSIHYLYDTNTIKLVSTTLATGLVRSNIYYSSGTYKGFLQAQMEVGVRTNYFVYDSGNVIIQTNELGLAITNTYDNLDRLTSTTYPDGTTISNVYDKLDLVGVKDRNGNWTHYGYNQVRQLIAVTNANGQVTQYQYCGCGAPSEVIRQEGTNVLIDTFAYDLNGWLTNATYADGYQLNYVHNGDGSVQIVKDGAGHQLNFGYIDLSGRLVVSSVAVGLNTLLTRQFDEYGRVTNSTDANFVTVTNGYDSLNRLVARRSIGGSGFGTLAGLESFKYDATGMTNYTDPLGHITQFVRDSAGRVLFETNANNEALGFTYNGSDELLTLTDGKNQTTTWGYDTRGRVTNKVDAAGNTVFKYNYDSEDRLTNRWTPAKGSTAYSYDALGNLTSVDYSHGSNTTAGITLTYDGLNRLTNMIDGTGTNAFTWTAGDQLASESGPWPDGTVSYGYTQRFRTALNLAQPNASAWSQTYDYDSFMRLLDVVSPAGDFNYTYTGNAHMVSMLSLPNGAMIVNDYDDLARLTSTGIGATGWFSDVDVHAYSYDAASQRTQQVFTAGNYVNYGYDNIGQLKTAQGYESGGTARLQEQFGYGYDAAWNLNWRTNNALVQAFNVNNLNELTTSTNKGTLTVAGTATEPEGGYSLWGWPPGVTNVTVSGTGLSSGTGNLYLDGTWARTGATPANGSNFYTATAKDTYGRTSTGTTTVTLPATNTFAYDLNGNLLSDGTRYFAYDDENQLVSVWATNGWRSDFAYDGMLRRRTRKEWTWNGSAWIVTNFVRYVYDGNLVIQERDTNNLPRVTYTRGSDLSGSLDGAGGIGGLLARTDNGQMQVGGQLAHTFYHCDGIGNVTSLISTNQALVAQYQYDPYGNILSKCGLLADVNSYQFSSKEFHTKSALYCYGYRFYDPTLQRWSNRDPFGDRWELRRASLSLNLYRFGDNAPTGFVDAYGLFCWAQFGRGLFGLFKAGLNAVAVAGSVEECPPCAVYFAINTAGNLSSGLGNIIASFSSDRELANKFEDLPSDVPEALGMAAGYAIGGNSGAQKGRAVGGIIGGWGDAIHGGIELNLWELGSGEVSFSLSGQELDELNKNEKPHDTGCK